MIALARKYRPKQFADLIVQDHVAAALRGAVAHGRTAHGYLFAGPRGVGKTTAARILAMALNCARRAAGAGEPCGACDSCTRIWTGAANLDVVELDAASNRGVDDARELRERAMYAASAEGRHKVYIVDEAHMLTREAWNALLKILEEPPPRVVFVFATTEPQKIALSAAPILSRLQRFDFRRIGPHAIVERLRHVVAAEGLAVEDDALHLIAKSADGGMRDALSMLDQVLSFGEGPVTAGRVREVLGLISDELYGELLRVVAEQDVTGVFPLVDRLVEAGADLGEFVSGAGETLRAVLAVGVGGEAEGLTEGLQARVRARARRRGGGAGPVARRGACGHGSGGGAGRHGGHPPARYQRGARRGHRAAAGCAGAAGVALRDRARAHHVGGSGERGAVPAACVADDGGGRAAGAAASVARQRSEPRRRYGRVGLGAVGIACTPGG